MLANMVGWVLFVCTVIDQYNQYTSGRFGIPTLAPMLDLQYDSTVVMVQQTRTSSKKASQELLLKFFIPV